MINDKDINISEKPIAEEKAQASQEPPKQETPQQEPQQQEAPQASLKEVIEKLYHKWQDKLPVKVLLAGLFWYCIWRLLLEGNNPFMYFSF